MNSKNINCFTDFLKENSKKIQVDKSTVKSKNI